MAFAPQEQYDGLAGEYATIDEIPHMRIENELIVRALADCTGCRVLDLGGGSGSHARQAIEAGAALVDVVDVSPGMLQLGRETEDKAGRNSIHFHQADISTPLSANLPSLPQDGYDVVMAIWPFDHARNISELEGMWQNVATYLKPAGRFVGVRVGNPYSESAKTGKYGSQFVNIEKIEGGLQYQVAVGTTPPFSFEATSMETSYNGSLEVPHKFGLVDIKTVPLEDADEVKNNLDYYGMLLKDPHFVVFTATKK